MKKPIQINIPTPCHEKWAEMTPADRGRYCASCQKTVIDFTKMSDRKVIATYKKGGYECGHFLNSQLNRNLLLQNKNAFWRALAAAIISFFTLGNSSLFAQNKDTIPQHLTSSKEEAKETYTIKWTVKDKDNNPLKGAKVIYERTGTKIFTDEKGNFSLTVTDGDFIIIKYRGKMDKKVYVYDFSPDDIIMYTHKEYREMPKRIGRYF